MRAFAGAVTLALVGIIVADLMIHPEGVRQAGLAINNVLTPTFGAMLGKAP